MNLQGFWPLSGLLTPDLRSVAVFDDTQFENDFPEKSFFANVASDSWYCDLDDVGSSIDDEMSEKNAPKVNLARANQPDFWISMEAFFDFSFWLAEEIEDLVAQQQIHHATVAHR